jgi:hypothetical protein
MNETKSWQERVQQEHVARSRRWEWWAANVLTAFEQEREEPNFALASAYRKQAEASLLEVACFLDLFYDGISDRVPVVTGTFAVDAVEANKIWGTEKATA